MSERDEVNLLRTELDIKHAIDVHGDTIWRVCFLYFGKGADAQDAFQETIVRYAYCKNRFEDDEHRKAWLIRVATNVCKDMLKAAHRKNLSLDEESGGTSFDGQAIDDQRDELLHEIFAAMMKLSTPLRTSLYLALYEGYSVPEIATMLDANINTVYSWIARGKHQLRKALR